LAAVVQEAYVHGVSTRKVDELVKALGIGGISKSRVSELCKELDEEVERSRKLDVLRRHCEDEGRDYDEIEKTCMFRFDTGEGASNPDELIEQLRSLAGLGIQTAIGFIPPVDPIARLEEIGREVIPAAANL
jgi:hypothetical protein